MTPTLSRGLKLEQIIQFRADIAEDYTNGFAPSHYGVESRLALMFELGAMAQTLESNVFWVQCGGSTFYFIVDSEEELFSIIEADERLQTESATRG